MLNNSIYGAKFATNPQALASRCAFHSINNSNLGFKKKKLYNNRVCTQFKLNHKII